MRAFIAIELPREIKDYLKQLQDKLKTAGLDLKLVEPVNIHLTLKFLGEINEQQTEKIIKAMENVSDTKPAFKISLGNLGVFPKITSPRIIWIGIDVGASETIQIAKELEEKISLFGIPREEKRFSAHITIARIKSAINIEGLVQNLKHLTGQKQKAELGFQATRISLIKSTLTPKGPLYETLKEVSLKTN